MLVVGGYFVNSYLENKTIREAERRAKEQILQVAKASVSQMVSRTEAIDDWKLQLNKIEESRFFGPVLTIELEKLWLQSRPILFIGAIKDISTADLSQYTVLVESGFGSFERMSSGNMAYTELELSLISSKEIIDSFLEKHPDLFKDYGLNNEVAVAARIHSIRTRTFQSYNELTEEVVDEEVKIGDGELIDIVYTGDVQ